MREAVVVAASFLLLAAMGSPAGAAPKPTLQGEVELSTYETAAIVAGDRAWIALNWRGGGGDVTDFRLVVKKADAGVEVAYPASTATYTSLWGDDTLSDGELDFTAIRLTVPYEIKKDLKLNLGLSYQRNGKPAGRDFLVRVPVIAYQGGQDLQQLTQTLGRVTTGGSTWVGVSYAGMAPRLDGFQLEVTDSAGLAVFYPGDGSASSLYHDARLEDGETDVARFLIDTEGVAAGTYTLQVRATYRRDTTPGQLAGSVELEVVDPAG